MCTYKEKKRIFPAFIIVIIIIYYFFFLRLGYIQYARMEYNKLATLRYDGQNGFVMCVLLKYI